jgi:hypothetical protein
MSKLDEVKKEIGGVYSFEKKDTKNGVDIYLCTAKNKELIPSKVIAAYNPITDRVGYSIVSEDEAIEATK